ncbi:uncharacterized protein LOC117644460 [Thrips palmi]|uniref:Uncharacterized protein LOC117644460 n=1 Tax=Thrips palmi TaxID=161013 RepID=A0A6P8YZY9_THRPL|nr:uncharacterized protein LOC117644460 [Thrips palmi]
MAGCGRCADRDVLLDMCCPIIADSGCGCSLELCCKIQGFYSAIWSASKTLVLSLVLDSRLKEGSSAYAWAAAMPVAFLATGIAVNALASLASVAFLVGVYQKRPNFLSPYLLAVLAQMVMHVMAVMLFADDSIHFFVIGLVETCLLIYMLRGATSHRFFLRDAKAGPTLSSNASTDVTVVVMEGQQNPSGAIQLTNLSAETGNAA